MISFLDPVGSYRSWGVKRRPTVLRDWAGPERGKSRPTREFTTNPRRLQDQREGQKAAAPGGKPQPRQTPAQANPGPDNPGWGKPQPRQTPAQTNPAEASPSRGKPQPRQTPAQANRAQTNPAEANPGRGKPSPGKPGRELWLGFLAGVLALWRGCGAVRYSFFSSSFSPFPSFLPSAKYKNNTRLFEPAFVTTSVCYFCNLR